MQTLKPMHTLLKTLVALLCVIAVSCSDETSGGIFTFDSYARLMHPRFSQDGRQIAMIGVKRSGEADLIVTPSAPKGRFTLLQTGVSRMRPSWDDDDELIYFGRPTRTGVEVMNIPASGGEPTLTLPSNTITSFDVSREIIVWSRSGQILWASLSESADPQFHDNTHIEGESPCILVDSVVYEREGSLYESELVLYDEYPSWRTGSETRLDLAEAPIYFGAYYDGIIYASPASVRVIDEIGDRPVFDYRSVDTVDFNPIQRKSDGHVAYTVTSDPRVYVEGLPWSFPR